MKIEHIDKPRQGFKYRRIMYGGSRKEPPKLNDLIYVGSNSTFKQEVKSVGIYPTLIVWNLDEGKPERRYSEIVKTD